MELEEQENVLRSKGLRPFATYTGKHFTQEEVNRMNGEAVQLVNTPSFRRLNPNLNPELEGHVSLVTFQNYSDGLIPEEMLMRDYGKHIKACYRCSEDFKYYKALNPRRQ